MGCQNSNRTTSTRLTRRVVWLAASALLLVCGATAARCQAPEQFYKARQLTMLVFTGPGSTYDIYARLLVRHLGKHIPGNPTFIVQNMVGAGGFKLVDYLYRIAPADGSVMGTIGRGLPFEPMLGDNPVNFDPLRFTWLGSMNRDTSLAMAWSTAKVKNFDDLRNYDLLVPGTCAGADSEIIPLAINKFAGTRFKIIEGYRDTPVAALAMERGELDGLAYWSWNSIMEAHPDWIRDEKVNLLFHTGPSPLSGVPTLPSIRDLVEDPADKKALQLLLAREMLGRPFLAPPAVPSDRAAVLRTAFAETLLDPEFQKDAHQARLDTDLVTGAELDTVLKDSAAAPPQIIGRLKQALGRN
jgi:tripartite-type tricarboxylate transporter receptor subunit TctC